MCKDASKGRLPAPDWRTGLGDRENFQGFLGKCRLWTGIRAGKGGQRLWQTGRKELKAHSLRDKSLPDGRHLGGFQANNVAAWSPQGSDPAPTPG